MTVHPEYRRRFIKIFMGLAAAPWAGVWFSRCKFYASAPGEASGPCAILLPRKHVVAGGWCAAWIKRD